ncbi:MAG: methyltransferase domain-containing protein [Armatimonadota bacterium]
MIESDFWRTAMYRDLAVELARAPVSGEGVEFGGSNGVIQGMFPDVSFETREYPEHDALDPASWERAWDVVVMDQVLEHVKRPWEVFERLGKHARTAVVTVPFLCLVHPCPDDYWRMTEDGLRELAAGFDEVTTGSWGNAEAVRLHLETGFSMEGLLKLRSVEQLGSLARINRPSTPIMVWAVMRKNGA